VQGVASMGTQMNMACSNSRATAVVYQAHQMVAALSLAQPGPGPSSAEVPCPCMGVFLRVCRVYNGDKTAKGVDCVGLPTPQTNRLWSYA
jgi:hypothetical protein